MNAHQKRSTNSARLKLSQGRTPVFWGGALVVVGVLAAVLYCLLTRQIPV
jgi:hypothetical protein